MVAILQIVSDMEYADATYNAIEYDRPIVSFRNRLVHACDSIDNSVVWSILARHLKPLKGGVNLINR